MMALQLHPTSIIFARNGLTTTLSSPPRKRTSCNSRSCRLVVVASTSAASSSSTSGGISVSDVVWPSAGAFAAMALLGRLDGAVAAQGLSFTVAPLGAVCAVLFATPNSPAAQKQNMFVAQIGCAALGVLALSVLGPGWLARAVAVSTSIAFMIITGATHPPAASLPIMFIDGSKFHHLNMWYALFPGATGCILLCLIQEMVIYLKNNYKF
ncbi:uncharacterized protein M6B38_199480 [Iris pallida]|uniref:HPP transmembrane region domain-containing protein n=1 Tax=Iris pallida TaxID=29817 RepID=A0AAX6EAH0_IRIPA|nr:uncharacterized protein M6B38_199480 [Iris pallida]